MKKIKWQDMDEETLPLNEQERKWIKVLERLEEENIERRAESTKDWAFFLNYSSLATGVLRWYEFRPEAELLEIGPSYGALTGFLADSVGKVVALEGNLCKAYMLAYRYRKRHNLEVVHGNPEDFLDSEKTFDYIMMNAGLGGRFPKGTDLKAYSSYLKQVKNHLKPGGILLLTVENRFGIDRMCGKPMDEGEPPFEMLMYESSRQGHRYFSRKEVNQMLLEASFEKYRMYYPMPDHRMTQAVYSQEHLPRENYQEKVIHYYDYKDSMLANPSVATREIIRNGLFEQMANSFLVEATVDGDLSDVEYSLLTLDRGQEQARITSIGSTKVKKSAVYSKGRPHVHQMLENHRKLALRGLPMVPHQEVNHIMVMPKISQMTLSEYLSQSPYLELNQVYEIFDELYQWILASSDDTKECDMEGYEVTMGPILQEAYIDMVPFNCFRMPDGKLLFFDQEYVCKNYPAKYILFRGIFYTYIFSSALKENVPLEQIKKRYQLESSWEIFRREEEKFIQSNRRYDMNVAFWDHTHIESGRIKENKKRLSVKRSLDDEA